MSDFLGDGVLNLELTSEALEGFLRDTGILAKNLKGYWIIL